jgi:hypothetical protein
MSKSKVVNKYREFGAVTIILGIWLLVYFLLDKGVRGVLFGYWIYYTNNFNIILILIFIFTLGWLIKAIILVALGIVLVVRGSDVVVSISLGLLFNLLMYYLFLMSYPFLFGGCIGWFYCGPEV